jgi:hypothetical protein
MAAHVMFEMPLDDIVGAVNRTTDRVRELVQLNLVHGCPISLCVLGRAEDASITPRTLLIRDF